MIVLAEGQRSLTDALRNMSISPLANMRGSRSEHRLAIYRNNAVAKLTSALATRYPVVKRLVGKEFFRSMAREYIAGNPPRSPVMLYYGEKFPDFVETFRPARPVPYLGAMARLEMARALASHAAKVKSVGASALAALQPRQFSQLRVTLHPSASIVTSSYPIYSIWSVNQTGAATIPVSPWAAEAALIARPLDTVEVTKLRLGEAEFLQALRSGETMIRAAEIAAKACSRFNVPRAMALLVKARVVAGFGPTAQLHVAN